MGYCSYDLTGSDVACDEYFVLCEIIVKQLRKAEKLVENEFNTDGMLNVGFIIRDSLGKAPHFLNEDSVRDYLDGYLARLAKYIKENSLLLNGELKGDKNLLMFIHEVRKLHRQITRMLEKSREEF